MPPSETPPSDPAAVFDALLSPLPRATFFADYYRRQPLLLQGRDPDRYRALFTVADLEHLAHAAPDLVAPTTRLVAGPERLTLRPGPLLAQLRAAFDAGYTIIIDSVQRFVPALAAMARELEAFIGGEAHFNLYYAPRGGRAFPVHADHHQVIVLQVAGRKSWRVYDERPELVPGSLRRQTPPADALGPPVLTPTLAPGDLLYVPLGRFHEASANEEASLHLSIGLYPYTLGRMLHEVLGDLMYTELDFLEPVAPDSEAQRARITTLLERVAARTDVEQRHRAHRARLIDAMPIIPGDTFAPQPPLESAEQWVEKRAGMICCAVPDGAEATLHFPGGTVRGPLLALRFVEAARGPFRPVDLPGELPRALQLLLAWRLVKDGLLAVRAGDQPGAEK